MIKKPNQPTKQTKKTHGARKCAVQNLWKCDSFLGKETSVQEFLKKTVKHICLVLHKSLQLGIFSQTSIVPL